MSFYIFKCFCNVSICNLGIKLGFRSGKSPLCTLFRGDFPGPKFGLYRSISVFGLSHLLKQVRSTCICN